MNYVYILKCSDGTFYIGYTKDVKRRLAEHNMGIGCKYTFGRRPVEVKYIEQFKTRSQAMKREFELKKLTKKEKIELINLKFKN